MQKIGKIGETARSVLCAAVLLVSICTATETSYVFYETARWQGETRAVSAECSVSRVPQQRDIRYTLSIRNGAYSADDDSFAFALQAPCEFLTVERAPDTQQFMRCDLPPARRANALSAKSKHEQAETTRNSRFVRKTLPGGKAVFSYSGEDHAGAKIEGVAVCDSAMTTLLWDGFAYSHSSFSYMATTTAVDSNGKPLLDLDSGDIRRRLGRITAPRAEPRGSISPHQAYEQARNAHLEWSYVAEQDTNPLVTTCILVGFVGVHAVDSLRSIYTDIKANGRFDFGSDGSSFLKPIYHKAGEGYAWAGLNAAKKLGLRQAEITEEAVENAGESIGTILHLGGETAALLAGGSLGHMAHASWGRMAHVSGALKQAYYGLGKSAWTMAKLSETATGQALHLLTAYSLANEYAASLQDLSDGAQDNLQATIGLLKRARGYLAEKRTRPESKKQQVMNRLRGNYRPGGRRTASHDPSLWTVTGRTRQPSASEEQATQAGMAWLNALMVEAQALAAEAVALYDSQMREGYTGQKSRSASTTAAWQRLEIKAKSFEKRALGELKAHGWGVRHESGRR